MIRMLLPVLALSAVLGVAVGHATRPAAAAQYHCNQVNYHPNSLPNAQVNVPYSQQIWVTPANMDHCIWNVTGLPSGLIFTPGPNTNDGTISGTPLATGTSLVSIGSGCVYILGTICPGPTLSLTVTP
jgi:hypothetical protein